jgi:hypothetical protein
VKAKNNNRINALLRAANMFLTIPDRVFAYFPKSLAACLKIL